MDQTMDARHDVTELLLAWRRGDPEALDRLVALVYEKLRRIAHGQLAREDAGHTLGTTALVHEAYLRLIDTSRVQWRDRAHFFGVTSAVMRRVLVDYARRYNAVKRGGGAGPLSLDETVLVVEERADALVALDDGLTRLTAMDERLGRVVECRFFGGLSEEETAEVLGVSARTVRRDWVMAKGWLYQKLRQCQE
jgi:RNA polymerase sigma factor (TIGR02999 family)